MYYSTSSSFHSRFASRRHTEKNRSSQPLIMAGVGEDEAAERVLFRWAAEAKEAGGAGVEKDAAFVPPSKKQKVAGKGEEREDAASPSSAPSSLSSSSSSSSLSSSPSSSSSSTSSLPPPPAGPGDETRLKVKVKVKVNLIKLADLIKAAMGLELTGIIPIVTKVS
jgi:hypothetical protein